MTRVLAWCTKYDSMALFEWRCVNFPPTGLVAAALVLLTRPVQCARKTKGERAPEFPSVYFLLEGFVPVNTRKDDSSYCTAVKQWVVRIHPQRYALFRIGLLVSSATQDNNLPPPASMSYCSRDPSLSYFFL